LKHDLERIKDSDEHCGRDLMLDKLHGENLELSGQLVAQTQARLNLSEMMDVTMENGVQVEGGRP